MYAMTCPCVYCSCGAHLGTLAEAYQCLHSTSSCGIAACVSVYVMRITYCTYVHIWKYARIYVKLLFAHFGCHIALSEVLKVH